MPPDDRTVAYILSTRQPFEDLRQIACDLAGLLLLSASGAREANAVPAAPDHPMLVAAERLLQEAAAMVGRAEASGGAALHHHHLLLASACVERAVGVARSRGFRDIDPVLEPLRAAYEHLQHASRILPGFEIVSFDRGCCAAARRSTS